MRGRPARRRHLSILVYSLCPDRRFRSGDRHSAVFGRGLRPFAWRRQMQPAGPPSSGLGPAQGERTVDRAEKKECVDSLAAVFKSTSAVVVAHYSGLTVAQMQSLRKQMRAAGAHVQVAKNRLVKIALEGSEVTSISGLMRGPTLIAYSSDPVAAAKVAVTF